jgi:UDP-N-acetylmuramate dehydrogenase
MNKYSHLEEKLQENTPLYEYSTLGVGGPARYFLQASDDDIVAMAVEWAKERHLPLFILGGGSNILIADRGFPGLVLHIAINGIGQTAKNDKIILNVAAGEEWDSFVAHTVSNGWYGIECLSGIPGKVGATPIQNVGAYGQEVKETITSLQAYDRESQQIVTFSAAQCQFSYRQSIFKTIAIDRYIILRVSYALALNGKPNLRYTELQRHLDNSSVVVSPATVRTTVLNIRREKAMVLDANDTDTKSAGSFFLNPIVSKEKLATLNAILHHNKEIHDDEEIPAYTVSADQVKLSAAWLIEHAGFYKGYNYGRVGISTKHALALVNRNNGSAEEIKALAEKIQQSVVEKFAIQLIPEPIFVGF